MNLDFFLLFEKKIGWSGDGKRNVLLGWPYIVIKYTLLLYFITVYFFQKMCYIPKMAFTLPELIAFRKRVLSIE